MRPPRAPQNCLGSLMGIPPSSLQKVRKLGEGEFGVVLEGVYTSADGGKVGGVSFSELANLVVLSITVEGCLSLIYF